MKDGRETTFTPEPIHRDLATMGEAGWFNCRGGER